MALEFTDSNFQETVLNSTQPVLVDFWAEWCGPCRMVGPVVEEIARDMEGKAVVGKLDVDSNPNIATRYGIRSIPTLLFTKSVVHQDLFDGFLCNLRPTGIGGQFQAQHRLNPCGRSTRQPSFAWGPHRPASPLPLRF